MNGPQDQVSDEQAMWRVQKHNDHTAFDVLVQRWQLPLRRLARRMLADEHRAEDVAQEAFCRIFTRRREYRPDHRVSTWLWRITINLCHDELRRRQRRPESPLDPPVDSADDGLCLGPWSGQQMAAEGATPAEHAALADNAGRVRAALQQLPAIYRSVVVLRHYEALKFSEIATVLAIPEGTVKSRMVEGLARLAKLLGPVLADRTPEASATIASTPPPSSNLGPALFPALITP